MKLAFSTLGCPNWTFSEIFATAKDLGFDGVEIRGIGKEIFAPDIAEFSDSKIDATLAKIKRLGIEIPCVTSGICVRDYGKEKSEIAIVHAAKHVRKLGLVSRYS